MSYNRDHTYNDYYGNKYAFPDNLSANESNPDPNYVPIPALAYSDTPLPSWDPTHSDYRHLLRSEASTYHHPPPADDSFMSTDHQHCREDPNDFCVESAAAWNHWWEPTHPAYNHFSGSDTTTIPYKYPASTSNTSDDHHGTNSPNWRNGMMSRLTNSATAPGMHDQAAHDGTPIHEPIYRPEHLMDNSAEESEVDQYSTRMQAYASDLQLGLKSPSHGASLGNPHEASAGNSNPIDGITNEDRLEGLDDSLALTSFYPVQVFPTELDPSCVQRMATSRKALEDLVADLEVRSEEYCNSVKGLKIRMSSNEGQPDREDIFNLSKLPQL